MTVQIFVYKFLFTIVFFGKMKEKTHETFHILKIKTPFEKNRILKMKTPSENEPHFENGSSFRNAF